MINSHDVLVHFAERILREGFKCVEVVVEPRYPDMECPDAIGWQEDGASIVIECKTTRGDFTEEWRRTERKWFRRNPDRGMGDLRLYLAPKGVLRSDEVHDVGWGLVEVHGGQAAVAMMSTQFNANRKAEVRLLIKERLKPPSQPPQLDLFHS